MNEMKDSDRCHDISDLQAHKKTTTDLCILLYFRSDKLKMKSRFRREEVKNTFEKEKNIKNLITCWCLKILGSMHLETH